MSGNASDDPVKMVGAVAAAMVLLLVPLSLALALWVRRRYVAAIGRLQRQAGLSATAVEPPAGVPTPPPPLAVVVEDASAVEASGVARAALAVRRRVLTAQFVCGLLFWYSFLFLAVFGSSFVATMLRASGTGELGPPLLIVSLYLRAPLEGDWTNAAFFCLFVVGPPAVAWAMQAGLAKRRVYSWLVVGGAALMWATGRSSGQLWQPIAIAGVLGSLAIAIAAVASPRIRGATVPLLAALSVGIAVWLGLGLGFEALVPKWLGATGLGTAGDVAELVLLAVSSPGSVAVSLAWLARGYERKRFSDVQLADLAFWVLAALAGVAATSMAVPVAPGKSLARHLTVLTACWLLFRIGLRLWLRGVARRAPPSLGPVLVLRVFKEAGRSEDFMDRLMSFWRFAAPAWMIGGTDLAGANLEPGEFFAFVRRRLAGQFVRSRDAIPGRIGRLDGARDPDARFRVNELFCTDETWRPTVVSLIGRAGVVVLDLREFHPGRAGTRYEMYELMNSAPIRKIVPLIGAGDDEAAIVSELHQAWSAMSDSSPNRRSTDVVLKVRRVRGSTRDIRGLFTILASTSEAANAEPRAAEGPCD